MPDLELRNRRGGAGPAEQEAAFVEPEVAGDRAAFAARPDLQRPGHPRGDVVAVEQKRLAGVEIQVEQSAAG